MNGSFALALEPIKHELLLSDSQLGLMTGIAFFAFYAIAGIPIARWADNGNRVTITALAVGLSGIMVSLCGIASSFFQLLLARSGIAVGEAGVTPAVHSLLSEYFDRRERPRAMAIYMMSYTISMILSYLVGAWLIDAYGWRTTFMLIGAPGLLIAILVKVTLKEPRSSHQAIVIDSSPTPTLVATFETLWLQRSFRQILILFCLGYFFSAGVSQWLPTFFIRSHNMTMPEVGVWLASAYGIFGTIGIFLGGYFASRYAARNEKLQMRVLAFTTIGYGLAHTIAFLSPNKHIVFVSIAIGALLLMLSNGPMFAAIQSLVNDRMRSMAIAVTFLFGNLIGFGLGPLALGVVSDLLGPEFGQDSLRYTLVLFCPGTILIGLFYWKLSNIIEEDIEIIELQENGRDVHENFTM